MSIMTNSQDHPIVPNGLIEETMTISFLSNLECSGCGKGYSYEQIHTFCPACQSPLVARYDLEAVRQKVDRDELARRQKGMWRWHELLPVQKEENQISLGEGDTPLLLLPRIGKSLGLCNLYVKDESSNPTGSFKARGLAAAISKARELGIEKVIIPTAGNAGGAIAAYSAPAGRERISSCPKILPSRISKRAVFPARNWYWAIGGSPEQPAWLEA